MAEPMPRPTPWKEHPAGNETITTAAGNPPGAATEKEER